MLWTPSAGAVKVISNSGIVGTGSPGSAVVSHATVANSFGSVVELISAANNVQDSWGIWVHLEGGGAATTINERTTRILIGGATDDVLIPPLICGDSVIPGAGFSYFFPLHVPGGVRIAADAASVRLGSSARVLVYLFGGCPPPFRVGRKVTALGTQVNNSSGQTLTVAASGGAASATQMIAPTTEDYFAFVPGFQPQNDASITPAGFINVGIGVGAATEERIGTWWFSKTTAEDSGGPVPAMPAFYDAPAGTRITMLCSNVGANDTGGYGGLVYAVS